MKNNYARKKYKSKEKVKASNNPSTNNSEYNVVLGSKQYHKALQMKAKYNEMAKESFSLGDRVQGESFLQYADHYSRIINEAQRISKLSKSHVKEANSEDKNEENTQVIDVPSEVQESNTAFTNNEDIDMF